MVDGTSNIEPALFIQIDRISQHAGILTDRYLILRCFGTYRMCSQRCNCSSIWDILLVRFHFQILECGTYWMHAHRWQNMMVSGYE